MTLAPATGAPSAAASTVPVSDAPPDSITCCGLPVPSSAIDRVASYVPPVGGWYSTAIVHESPALIVNPAQPSSLIRNALGCAPPIVAPSTVSSPEPELVTVMASGELVEPPATAPNPSALGVTLTPLISPEPLSATVCGAPAASSASVSAALKLPFDGGVNVSCSEHELPGSTACPLQPSALIANADACAPPIAALETSRGAWPVFATVNVCTGLSMPIGSPGNTSEPVTPTDGSELPCSAIACGLVFAVSTTLSEAVSLPAVSGVKSTPTVHESSG